MVRRDGGEVVEGFVDAGGQTGGGDIVAQDALIHHLGEEARLGRQFVEQVGNIFLSLGREGFLVAGASAEGDDDDLALLCRGRSTHKRTGAHQSRAQRHTRSAAQEITPAAAEMLGDISGSK